MGSRAGLQGSVSRHGNPGSKGVMGCLALGEIGVGLGVGSGTGCLREELGWVRVGLGWG